MRIVFVRHGHPNYKDDCLTELGHLHAKAAADRPKNEGIQKIYSSTCGRAFQTAEYTAKVLSRVSDDVFYVILNTDVVFIAYSIVTFILDMVKPIKKD